MKPPINTELVARHLSLYIFTLEEYQQYNFVTRFWSRQCKRFTSWNQLLNVMRFKMIVKQSEKLGHQVLYFLF